MYLRDFLAWFDGAKGTAVRKQILDETGLTGQQLDALRDGNVVDTDRAISLLAAIRRHTRPKPGKALGVLGKKVLEAWALAVGGAPGSIKYKKVEGWYHGDGSDPTKPNIPIVVEVGFAITKNRDDFRTLVAVNASPMLGDPFDWQLGCCSIPRWWTTTIPVCCSSMWHHRHLLSRIAQSRA
jgi:hypothetical protein